jgi:hypothetical protein
MQSNIICLVCNFYRLYVFCENCLNWFHPDCVGITSEEAKRVPDYFCPDCSRDKGMNSSGVCANSYLFRKHRVYLYILNGKVFWIQCTR